MHIPTFYEGLVNSISINQQDFLEMWLSNEKNGDFYDIYYYGDVIKDCGLIIATEEAYDLIVAKSVKSGEELILFDGAWNLGYDYLLWQSHNEKLLLNSANRKLEKYNTQAVKVVIEVGQGIDYEEEKNDYNLDENNCVLTDHGKAIPWDDLKKNGIDWLSISLVDNKGIKKEITEYELA